MVSKVVLWLMLIEIVLGVKMKKSKTFLVITVNFPFSIYCKLNSGINYKIKSKSSLSPLKSYLAPLSLLISSSISQPSHSYSLYPDLTVICISIVAPHVSVVATTTALHLRRHRRCAAFLLLLCCIYAAANALRLRCRCCFVYDVATAPSCCFCCSLGSVFVKSHLCFYLHKLPFVFVQFFYCIFHTYYCKILFVKK